MKIKIETCVGELVVPKIIADAYEKEEWKDKTLNEDENFHSWWLETELEFFRPEEGKLVDKEIAEFIVSMEIGFEPSEGGSPIEVWFEFEDRDYKYSICTYGWEEGLLRTVGYKEKGGDKK